MKSPFPGMDPYLERHWTDVHNRFTTYVVDALSPLLPDPLRARSEKRILIDEVTDDGERLRVVRQPDVLVSESRQPAGPAPFEPGEAATAVEAPPETVFPEPIIIQIDQTPVVERWVEILDASNGHKVVTVIELLSPGNKESGLLNRSYRQKVDDYARAGVSLVEIDLLGGTRDHLPVRWSDIPRDARGAHLACVRRGWLGGRWEAYPMSLRLPLREIPVPLRQSDPPAPLALQPLIDRVYSIGRYDDIDYSKHPDPPLSAEDDAWADALLRQAGRR